MLTSSLKAYLRYEDYISRINRDIGPYMILSKEQFLSLSPTDQIKVACETVDLYHLLKS